ncbi:MAG TPA: hypothetical protein VMJ33_03375 [Gallionella sp.]|nr:hypothetical protein [Gallionella sp.]
MKYLSYHSRPPSLLQKMVAVAGIAVLAGVALMLSAVLLAFLLSIGAAIFAWLWWNSRELRRQMRGQMKDFPPPGATVEREAFRGNTYDGEVIEGEAIRVDTKRDTP